MPEGSLQLRIMKAIPCFLKLNGFHPRTGKRQLIRHLSENQPCGKGRHRKKGGPAQYSAQGFRKLFVCHRWNPIRECSWFICSRRRRTFLAGENRKRHRGPVVAQSPTRNHHRRPRYCPSCRPPRRRYFADRLQFITAPMVTMKSARKTTKAGRTPTSQGWPSQYTVAV